MGQETILLVEDDAIFREAVSFEIEVAGYQVVQASHVDAALVHLKDQRISLVLTDVQMPGKTGVDLLNYVNSKSYDIPVVLMTGYSGITDKNGGSLSNAAAIIKKPFQGEDLIKLIKKVLQA